MIVSLLAWLIAGPVSVLQIILLIELVLGLAPVRRPKKIEAHPRTAILMPAHNEAAGIGAILQSLMTRIDRATRILVVADNCTDATAEVARALGVEVRERHNPENRGKGFALDFGRTVLAADPPDCVVVLDADCEVEGNAVALLATEATKRLRPVQGRYVMLARDDASPLVQISNFAFLVKNVARQRGTGRLGAPAVLGGTGMAFPWPLFADAPLASAALVEDLELGIALTRNGTPPVYLDSARIWSAAAAQDDTISQRTRWEQGYIKTAARTALPLIGQGLFRLSAPMLFLGLDLLVPPLAVLMTLSLAVAVAAFFFALMSGDIGPVLCICTLLAANMLALTAFWAREGRSVMRLSSLARIPGYMLWKVPIYLNLLRRRPTSWERTRRPGEKP